MSSFDEWYKKPLPGYDDSDAYYGKDDLEQAYNAGMERAAVIASNVKAPSSRFTIAAKIRNEIEK